MPAGGWNAPRPGETVRKPRPKAAESLAGPTALTAPSASITIHADPVVVSRASVVCPSCGSDEWRAASLIYAEGLSVSMARTRGTAVGAGIGVRTGQVSVGAAKYASNTVGSSQTMLSRMAEPPRRHTRPVVLWSVLTLLCGLVVLMRISASAFDGGTAFWALLTLIFAIVLASALSTKDDTYAERMRAYDNQKMCTRCGKFYVA
jgi:hypothetical protein